MRDDNLIKEPEYYGELSDKFGMPDSRTIKAYTGDAPATVMMNNSDEDKKDEELRQESQENTESYIKHRSR